MKIKLDPVKATAAWQKYIVPAILKQSPEDFKKVEKPSNTNDRK